MNYTVIILESIVWSLLWMAMIAYALRVYPFTLEHDYPEDVRNVANIQKPSSIEKRKGMIFSVLSLILLLGLLVAFGVLGHKQKPIHLPHLFLHIWMISMSWNMVDLVIVDWLLICMCSCKYFVLPNTEAYRGNKNYVFHFKGFLKGIVAMSIVALIATGIAYGIIVFFC